MVDLNEQSINLRALKKIDTNINEIILCAGQVAVYYYDVSKETWERKNIEGTLFFVRRAISPVHAFVVINRLNTINFVQTITKDLATNKQTPYLMYKNNENEIYCIWFYDKESCSLLNQQIESALECYQQGSMVNVNNYQINGVGGKKECESFGGQNNRNLDQSDLLKLLIMNKNSQKSPPQQSQFISLPKPEMMSGTNGPMHNNIVEPVAQKRSLNLKDLFESHLKIDNGNASSNKSESNDIFNQTQPVKQPSDHQLVKSSKSETPFTPTINRSSMLMEDTRNKMMQLKQPLKNLESSYGLHNEHRPDETSGPTARSPLPLINHGLQENLSLKTIQELMGNNLAAGDQNFGSPSTKLSMKNSNTENSMYLSMEQLKKTLIHLLKNDADFLHAIHTAYVENIRK
ncbi:mRNA-decapping enzyme 1A [Sarcoptes scabiei]|uniref:mRNA-decapping enzyme 1A n=1 Tax=Sarcoptes scabiei TaxID=52283 RepID=A0A132A124_SARSC|nr:mRNA-decapping enzyme 1A [Sarcoptes scabiei]KPM04643.1 hypothetical protein QR98_0030940 [Sarcoptes scabiei]